MESSFHESMVFFVGGGLSINFKFMIQITLIPEGMIPHKSKLDTVVWIVYTFM